MGVAFGFAWTPCIGPVLGAILTTAAVQESVGRGMLLLLFYGLGLGVPFVAAGAALGRALGAVRWLRRHSRAIGVASAVALISFGMIMITGNLSVIASWVTEFFESTPLRGSSTASDTAVPSWSSRSYASGHGCHPGRDEFLDLARHHPVVPVTARMLADRETPVSAYEKLVGDGPGFLLESVEGGEQWGRWSFLGWDPLFTLVARSGEVTVEGSASAALAIDGEGTPLEVLIGCSPV